MTQTKTKGVDDTPLPIFGRGIVPGTSMVIPQIEVTVRTDQKDQERGAAAKHYNGECNFQRTILPKSFFRSREWIA